MAEIEPNYNELKLLAMIRRLKPCEELKISKNQNGSLLSITFIPKPERTSLEISNVL